MDPDPNSHPILSYVMSRLPSIGPRFTPPASSSATAAVDIEQPAAPSPSPPTSVHVSDPKLFSSMANAVTTVYQTRSILKTVGPRPDHESIDLARSKLSEIDANLAKKLEETVLLSRPPHIDRNEWRVHIAERERELREAAAKEKRQWKAIIDLDELHRVYEGMAKEAEEKLVMLYEGRKGEEDGNGGGTEGEVVVSEDVIGVLQKGVMQRIQLSGRGLRVLPDAFGSIKGLLYLDVSNNQLTAIPDSIAGLDHLLELNVSSNLMESLPDSIGLLHNLKVLNASSNKLTALPDSICHCRSLVELDVSFNNLTYLPTNLGLELSNLQRLCIQYNKIRSLPSSICEMYSLQHLDAHFNELRGLPLAIGNLTNLEYLNLSSNFSDLKELPETFGDLMRLRELDLSNNQIHSLPYTFGRLDNLTKLNLEQNPLIIPPMEVVKQGVGAVKEFMAKRWLDLLVEEERKCIEEEANKEKETGWLTRSTSKLSNIVSGVSGLVSEYIGGSPRAPKDPYLEQQL